MENTFKRKTLYERGGVSNIFTLNPIKKIVTAPDGIIFYIRNNEYYYLWGEIIATRLIIQRKPDRNYGGGPDTFLTKTMELITDRKVFRFDVSSQFSDFHNSKKLISIIEDRIVVQTIKKKPETEFRQILLLFVLGVLLYYYFD